MHLIKMAHNMFYYISVYCQLLNRVTELTEWKKKMQARNK